jgi:hypothetical protein
MFEFPFIENDSLRKRGPELQDYLLECLARLLNHAKTLVGAGWSMDLTVTGIRFTPPDAVMSDIEESDDTVDEAIDEHLRKLGIDDLCETFTSRTLAEIVLTRNVLMGHLGHDQVLELRRSSERDHANDTEANKARVCKMLSDMYRIEQEARKRKLPGLNDYERGKIDGKVDTLGWILGWEWDYLKR